MTAPLPLLPSIALVGLMGAGKSSIGQRLARRLGIEFVDADAEIEKAAGMAVKEIFEHLGEARFRDGERRVIARLADGARRVIATGGGAFVDPETRALLLERCTVVWLDAEIEVLVERVSRNDKRPLLSGKDPGEVLRRLAAERNPLYAQAHLKVMSEAIPADLMAQRVADAIAAYQSDAIQSGM